MKSKNPTITPVEIIERKIYFIRGAKVMLDSDLAKLYGVTTKRLNEQLKRNMDRFPADFAFRLNREEFDMLNRSQIATGSQKHRDPKYLPYVFTEHGIAMLSSILKSKRAIKINILIVRAFIKLREMLQSHKDILIEIEKIKKEQKSQNQKIDSVINVINKLLNPPPDKTPKEPIGFRTKK